MRVPLTADIQTVGPVTGLQTRAGSRPCGFLNSRGRGVAGDSGLPVMRDGLSGAAIVTLSSPLLHTRLLQIRGPQGEGV